MKRINGFATETREPQVVDELNVAEIQDIDIALQILKDVGNEYSENADFLFTEAQGIILSYGKRVLPHLQKRLSEGKISSLDCDFFKLELEEEENDDDDDLDYLDEPNYKEVSSGFTPASYSPFLTKSTDAFSPFAFKLKNKTDVIYESSFDNSYRFFEDKRERKEVYKYCEAIGEYLRKEKVPNLVIIDRSSRPLYVGVREYLRAKYPKEKMPNMYFMNPQGFKAREELTPDEIKDIILDCEYKDNVTEGADRVKMKSQIFKEFQDTYKRLLRDKDRPVLVFDTCLHTGNSLKPVKEMLKEQGFSDIRIGAVNPSDSDSKVKTDFFITTQRPEKGCYSFDRDRMVEKTFSHVFSNRTTDKRKKMAGRQLREEIKRIVTEHL